MAVVPPTTVTAASLAAALKRPPGEQAVADALATTTALLGTALSGAWRDVPQAVVDDMTYRVGRAVYESRGRSAYGGSQATQVQGEQVQRPPRDPLSAVGPLLGLYVVGIG